MKKLIFLLLFMTSCASANPVPKTTETFVVEAKENTKPWRARVADVIFPEVNHQYIVDPTPVVTVHPFCYKTWDKPVCYNRPELGQEARLVGGGPL